MPASSGRRVRYDARVKRLIFLACFVMFAACVFAASPATTGNPVYLSDGWNVQSSANVQATGDKISQADYPAEGWFRARIPATVLAVELQNGRHGDIFTSTNFRSLPGGGYPIGADFGNMPMPANSPYAVSWWYRKVFTAAAG